MTSEEVTENITFSEGRATQTDALRSIMPELAERINKVWNPAWRKVMLVGIGASFAALASPMQQLRRSGILGYRTNGTDVPTITPNMADVAVLVSQSGHSLETVRFAERLQKAEITTLAITNKTHSPLSGVANLTLSLGGQPDSRVSTVGFMVTTAALGMLADYATGGSVSEHWAALPGRMDEVADFTEKAMDTVAVAHFRTGAVDVVAPTQRLTTAEAVALLFREGPLTPASAYDTRTYLHGPMDCAGKEVTHLLIGEDREHRLATQLRERTDRIFMASDQLRDDHTHHWTATQQTLIEVGMLQELVSATAWVRNNPVDDCVFMREDTKIGALGMREE